jgi:hypothetical protein
MSFFDSDSEDDLFVEKKRFLYTEYLLRPFFIFLFCFLCSTPTKASNTALPTQSVAVKNEPLPVFYALSAPVTAYK